MLSLAVTSVASLGSCTTEGAYRPAPDGGALQRFPQPPGRARKALV